MRRNGIKEIHLIGQNVNSYRPLTDSGLEGFAGATPFSRLMRAVAATGIERVKFNTSFPRDFHPDIVDAINENENLCNWVHLPVQSGSDRILRAMQRGHTLSRYLKKIDSLKASSRNISLTTDIIVGFPGETRSDFEDTVKAVEYSGYDAAYIFKYSRRPGTPAFEMADDVSPEEKTGKILELEAVQTAFTDRGPSTLLRTDRKGPGRKTGEPILIPGFRPFHLSQGRKLRGKERIDGANSRGKDHRSQTESHYSEF